MFAKGAGSGRAAGLISSCWRRCCGGRKRGSSSWIDIWNAWPARPSTLASTVDLGSIEHAVTAAVASLPGQPHRLRLLVDQEGVARVQVQPLPDTPEQQPVRIGLAPQPIDRQDVFFYHKTTRREAYEAARRSRPECDDVLLWNERGEITETCLANVAMRLDGELVTPPVDCGLLAGTLRGWLLEQGRLQERVITVDDLASCDEIYVLNSVRGMREAVLVGR